MFILYLYQKSVFVTNIKVFFSVKFVPFFPLDDVDDGEDMAENPKQNRVQNVLYLNDEDEEDEGDNAEPEQEGRKVMVSCPDISMLFPV